MRIHYTERVARLNHEHRRAASVVVALLSGSEWASRAQRIWQCARAVAPDPCVYFVPECLSRNGYGPLQGRGVVVVLFWLTTGGLRGLDFQAVSLPCDGTSRTDSQPELKCLDGCLGLTFFSHRVSKKKNLDLN